jgi:hypothetical protein
MAAIAKVLSRTSEMAPHAMGRSRQRGAGSDPRLLNSNRRRKEADREGEQHEAAECIDRHVQGVDHSKIPSDLQKTCAQIEAVSREQQRHHQTGAAKR